MNNTLLQQTNQLGAWLNQEVLPIWLERGLNQDVGCVQKLDETGQPVQQSSQPTSALLDTISAFSMAYQLNWHSEALKKQIPWMFKRLAVVAVAENRANGYVATIPQQEGQAPVYRLSDHAQAINASCLTYMALNNGADLRRAINITAWLDRCMTCPEGGWFEDSAHSSRVYSASYLSLLESYLNLHRCTNSPKWLTRAHQLALLFETYFYDSASSAVCAHADCADQAHIKQYGDAELHHCVRWLGALQTLHAITGSDQLESVHRLNNLTAFVIAKLNKLKAQVQNSNILDWAEGAALGLSQLRADTQYTEQWQPMTELCLAQLHRHFNVANIRKAVPYDLPVEVKGDRFCSTAGLLALIKVVFFGQHG